MQLRRFVNRSLSYAIAIRDIIAAIAILGGAGFIAPSTIGAVGATALSGTAIIASSTFFYSAYKAIRS